LPVPDRIDARQSCRGLAKSQRPADARLHEERGNRRGRKGAPVTLIGAVFFALLLVGAPVAFAVGLAGFVFFVTSDVMPLSIGVQKIATVSQSFPLLAVPFFVLAGHLM